MSTVTIGVASLGDTQRRLSAAFRGKKQGARISFASEDLLWKTLTPKRWALLKLWPARDRWLFARLPVARNATSARFTAIFMFCFGQAYWRRLRRVALYFLMTPSMWISC